MVTTNDRDVSDVKPGRPIIKLTADQLNPGDLVRLRSGGPLMTIHSINGDNIDCQWFTPSGELQSATFPIYMLTAGR